MGSLCTGLGTRGRGLSTGRSRCVATDRKIYGYWLIVSATLKMLRANCVGIDFYPGEEAILLATISYRNRTLMSHTIDPSHPFDL